MPWDEAVDYESLLAAVLADPDDDAPRLILSDWLDENGQSDRAEFIRTMCWVDQIRRDCSCPACSSWAGKEPRHDGPCLASPKALRPLYEKGHQLLSAGNNRKDWFLPRLKRRKFYGSWDFRRGFVEIVSCQAFHWDRAAPAVLALHPVREVRLHLPTKRDLDAKKRKWPRIRFTAAQWSAYPWPSSLTRS